MRIKIEREWEEEISIIGHRNTFFYVFVTSGVCESLGLANGSGWHKNS